jgi:hypothetical protein
MIMDRRNEQPQQNAYVKDLQSQVDEKELEREWVTIDGERYRLPYKMIKRVIFTDIRKEDFIDQEHAARLQYRLMLQDPVIKAVVDYHRSKITVIYNPKEADNHKEKMDVDEIIGFLKSEGVHVHKNKMDLEDYDYYANFYSYGHNPRRIREHAPYGWTLQKWREMKPEWEAKMNAVEKEKLEKFHSWQEQYMEEMEGTKEEKPRTLASRILKGREKKDSNKGKGFWFHGA